MIQEPIDIKEKLAGIGCGILALMFTLGWLIFLIASLANIAANGGTP